MRSSQSHGSHSGNASMQSNRLLWSILVAGLLCVMQAPTADARVRSQFPAPNAFGRRQYLIAKNYTKSQTLPMPIPVTVLAQQLNDTSFTVRFHPPADSTTPQIVLRGLWILRATKTTMKDRCRDMLLRITLRDHIHWKALEGMCIKVPG